MKPWVKFSLYWDVKLTANSRCYWFLCFLSFNFTPRTNRGEGEAVDTNPPSFGFFCYLILSGRFYPAIVHFSNRLFISERISCELCENRLKDIREIYWQVRCGLRINMSYQKEMKISCWKGKYSIPIIYFLSLIFCFPVKFKSCCLIDKPKSIVKKWKNTAMLDDGTGLSRLFSICIPWY